MRNTGCRIRVRYNTMIGRRILTILFLIFILNYFVFFLALLSPFLHANWWQISPFLGQRGNTAAQEPWEYFQMYTVPSCLHAVSSLVTAEASLQHGAQGERCLWHSPQELGMSRKDYCSRTGKLSSPVLEINGETALWALHYFYKAAFERTTEIEECCCQGFAQEVLNRRGIMVWLTHKRSQQGFPISKEKNCGAQNAMLVLQTLSQTSPVLSFPLPGIWKQERRKASKSTFRCQQKNSGAET